MATWTQADIDTLKAAIASGTSAVTFSSAGVTRSRTFQSLAEMRSLLAEMTADVAASSGDGTPYRLAATRKGL